MTDISTETISWSQIEAECGDYRQGFVAVFRKYEGRVTDELDAYGRPVEVTASSFARHAGIARKTFSDWLEKEAAAAPIPDRRDRTRESINRMPADEKAILAAELLADDDVAEQVERHRAAQRGPTFGPLPDPDEVGRRAAQGIARRTGGDEVARLIRSATGFLAEAILHKSEHGINNQSEYAEALGRHRHLLSVLDGADTLNGDDREWLASIGVDL